MGKAHEEYHFKSCAYTWQNLLPAPNYSCPLQIKWKKIHAYVVIIHEISNIEEFFSTWQEGEAIPQISLEC